jgi:hypothetical protein
MPLSFRDTTSDVMIMTVVRTPPPRDPRDTLLGQLILVVRSRCSRQRISIIMLFETADRMLPRQKKLRLASRMT